MHSPVLRHLPPEGGWVSDLARKTGLEKQSVACVVEDLVARCATCARSRIQKTAAHGACATRHVGTGC